MTDKKRDLLCSVLFLVFGGFMFIQSMAIVPMMGKDVGSGFVPKIVAIAIVAIALLKLVLTLSSKKEGVSVKSDEDAAGGLLTIAALAAYVLLFQSLGFLLSTMLYLFVQITILSNKDNRNFILFGIISVVAPIAVYILFVYVIKMPLPAGLLSF